MVVRARSKHTKITRIKLAARPCSPLHLSSNLFSKLTVHVPHQCRPAGTALLFGCTCVCLFV